LSASGAQNFEIYIDISTQSNLMSGMISVYQTLSAVLLALLGVIAIIDAKTWRIPNALNLSVFATGLLLATRQGIDGFVWAIVSAICAFGALLLVRTAFQKIRKRAGLGLGDVKFVGAIGAVVGLVSVPAVVLWACASALVLQGVSTALGQPTSWTSRLQFGPFLAFGTLMVWHFGYSLV
jgi:leader peptidase (prepilin peptidase) / N-methyltransferase